MATWKNSLCTESLIALLMVGLCTPVCVEVPSGTKAVQGKNMTLGCISCMKREEVEAITTVKWFYQPVGGEESLIYEFSGGQGMESKSSMQGRISWNGSRDLQDVSITIINVTVNDSGRFTCNVTRILRFETHNHVVQSNISIDLKVTVEDSEDFTSVLSEIMMYILLAFLTVWLLVEIGYCYRKISKAEVTQESITDYLAIPSENKENCSVPVEE
ncbi:sodium channel subunit beta-3 [Spea bombifrons]|uniref:sodium channel subunit beta-3 n=1 Tax=Spea bombifrons TaxID=233779 RepID=UPI00234B61FB|nr:sodium channel subunit beta-3 [Spea bombifrons]